MKILLRRTFDKLATSKKTLTLGRNLVRSVKDPSKYYANDHNLRLKQNHIFRKTKLKLY